MRTSLHRTWMPVGRFVGVPIEDVPRCELLRVVSDPTMPIFIVAGVSVELDRRGARWYRPCTDCGTPCPTCGYSNDCDVSHCALCGTPLDREPVVRHP